MSNIVEWMDIVKINDNYYLERFPVDFEDDRLKEISFGNDESEIINKLSELEVSLEDFESDPLYDCSKFFDSIRKKYNLGDDEEIKTELFDDLEAPSYIYEKFDIAWLGGYINGVNI